MTTAIAVKPRALHWDVTVDELANQINWNTMTTTVNNLTTTKRNHAMTMKMKNNTAKRKKQQHKARDGSVDIWVERDFHTETGPRLKQMALVNLAITVGGEVVKMCDKGKKYTRRKKGDPGEMAS